MKVFDMRDAGDEEDELMLPAGYSSAAGGAGSSGHVGGPLKALHRRLTGIVHRKRQLVLVFVGVAGLCAVLGVILGLVYGLRGPRLASGYVCPEGFRAADADLNFFVVML
jgi:hypothetical protein